MKLSDLNKYLLKSQKGSALLTVIILLALLFIFFQFFLLYGIFKNKALIEAKNERQCLYNAESAINLISKKAIDSGRYPDSMSVVELPWGDKAKVRFKLFGSLWDVTAESDKVGKGVSFNGLYGQQFPREYNFCVYNANTLTPLFITGNTTITGPIMTNTKGLEFRNLSGNKFTGQVTGKIESKENIELPKFNLDLVKKSLELYNTYLSIPPLPFAYYQTGKPLNRSYKSFSSRESAELSAKQNNITFPITFVSQQNLIIGKGYKLPEKSIFIAKDTLRIKDNVTGQNCVFSADYIEISDSVECSGQFFAKKGLFVSGKPTLSAPTLLFLKGYEETRARKGFITIRGSAQIFGSVVNSTWETLYREDLTRVIIDKNIIIKGFVYSANYLDCTGNIQGTVMTKYFWFYDNPSDYINWLRGGKYSPLIKMDEFKTSFLFENTYSYQKISTLQVRKYHVKK